MLFTGKLFINEEMQLSPGDQFQVDIRDGLEEDDDAALLNGEWLTVREVYPGKRFQPIGATGVSQSGYRHQAEEDLEISNRCGHQTDCWFFWWEMSAIIVQKPSNLSNILSSQQKTGNLPDV